MSFGRKATLIPRALRRRGKPLRRKVILQNRLSPGDVVVMTAAVRDLHLSNPDAFLTDVRTPCPDVWENNPYLTPLREEDDEVECITCDYPLIHRSNQETWHFLHAYIHDLSAKLGVAIAPTSFRGDIHLAPVERQWMSQVEEMTGEPTPFWIVNAGGKYDFTAKWWATSRWQEVVDELQGEVTFVQVGEADHFHPPLERVIDLRGKTSLRQLVRLVFHSQGVCSAVSLPMHLAAAVPTRDGFPRPCVVVAGGREPAHWESYPQHQFIHTLGALDCCRHGGCWKSRVRPLGDGSNLDAPDQLCLQPVQQGDGEVLPRCLDLITSADVVRRIRYYLRQPMPAP